MEQRVDPLGGATEPDDEPRGVAEHERACGRYVIPVRRDNAPRRFDRESLGDRGGRVSISQDCERCRGASSGITHRRDGADFRPTHIVEGPAPRGKRLEVDPLFPEHRHDRFVWRAIPRPLHQILHRGPQDGPRILESEGPRELP